MRNRILALAALAAAIGSPVAAQAQTGITVGRAPVVVESGPTIAVEQRPAFRDYVIEQRVPAFHVPDRVVVGSTLPEPASPIMTCRNVSAPRPIATPS